MKPNRDQEMVQISVRVPRWVSNTIRRYAGMHGEPVSAISRAWMMDAATSWLEKQHKK